MLSFPSVAEINSGMRAGYALISKSGRVFPDIMDGRWGERGIDGDVCKLSWLLCVLFLGTRNMVKK